MKRFSWSTFTGASLGALVFTFAGQGSAFANSFGSSGGGSSGGGSSGGSSHGSMFKGHGSSGGSSHGSLFKGHGSSGGSSHASLFSHGSSGGSSHGSMFKGHGSSGGSSHASLFSHGSSGGSSHGSMFKGHGSSGGSSHGSLFKGHGSSGGSSHGSLFSHGSSGGSSGGSYGGSSGGSFGLSYNGGSVVPSTQYAQNAGVVTGSNIVTTAPAPSAVPAYLNVNVPADAKVYLQDQLMPLEGTQRRFVSPELAIGSQHVYNVRVDVVRDGQTVSKTTQALVTAGQEIAVSVQFDGQNSKELVATVATVASR
jgi:uncharacterized protein (TIGR03000 family)